MGETRVVHCKKEIYTVLIDRTTPYGNPFPISRTCTREESIAKHLEWLLKWIENKEEVVVYGFSNDWVCEHLYLLEGEILGCWCKPLACHGDNLVKLIKER